MKLYDYIKLRENGAEITVYDKEYDMETYFYAYFYADKLDDEWNKAMEDLSKLLTVTKIIKDSVEVNFSELIESKMDNIKKSDLFEECDIDEIMECLDYIIEGNVSKKWMCKFVEALK